MMGSIVTPNRDRAHCFCDDRRYGDRCSCWHAKMTQLCQSCHKRINIDDCIRHDICGWTHTKCPIGNGTTERGLKTIEDGFNKVDYGSSFLQKLPNEEQRSMPSPLRLTFGGEEDDDAKMPATLEKGSHKKRPIKISQESDEEGESDGGDIGPDYDAEERYSTKRAKYEDTALIDASQGNYADQMRTDEQMRILSHEPNKGDVVVVNALAGCGKTTVSTMFNCAEFLVECGYHLIFCVCHLVVQTIALLCNKILAEHPTSRCLYLVYNSKAGEEAIQSAKFPESGMEIRTTHAYVKRHFFGVKNTHEVNPTGDYSIDDIIEFFDLRVECRRLFSELLHTNGGEKKLDKRAKVIAGYVRNTLKNFHSSADAAVKGEHVFWRARKNTNLSSRTKWREKVNVIKYVNWAAAFFLRVHEECLNIRNGGGNTSGLRIPHDAYLKVAQMENLNIPHEFVFIDEAQDMTACQAELFWGQSQRRDKIIYLFGDRYQQIYRFRGASRSFRDMVDASDPKFSLTGSFRFGKNIANCATCVLEGLGGDSLIGRSNDDGRVVEDTTMNRGVVLCRTQNGIFEHLYANRPARWCYLSGGPSIVAQELKKWKLDLESFIQGNTTSFTYKGDIYKSDDDINQYIEDEGDDDLYKAFTLLQFLKSQQKPIQEFYSDLSASYSPMREDETPDEYNGLVMSTVHKAKGLEFENVLIAADFRWKVIMSSFMNDAIHCDEANVLYVAITRSKCNLYLTEEASKCLRRLSAH